MPDTLDTLRLRYGRQANTSPELERLQLKQRRTELRADAIRAQITDLQTELTRLTSEQQRMDDIRNLLIDDTVERIRRERNEGWSPTPVTGYRLWAINPQDELVGATGHHWATPAMTAECPRARPVDDLPHTDQLCSSIGYGCGIYAAKSVDLLDTLPHNSAWVIGSVSLSGKVVEHEHGYRAAHAQVDSVVATTPTRHLITDGPERLRALFSRPMKTLDAYGVAGQAPNDPVALREIFEELERSYAEWI